MIANVSQFSAETVRTLKFATRARCVQDKAVVNHDTLENMESLHNENDRLKKELAMYRTLAEGVRLQMHLTLVVANLLGA